MNKLILTLVLLAQTVAASAAPAQTKKAEKQIQEPRWESIGACRVTEYCPICNDPEGYESSSGKELQNGDVACNWLPNGTRIRIDGKEYTVNDYCGTEAIDIFIDTDECWCDKNAYEEVYIKEE